MLTRCPKCATGFRVTREQLRARAGRVRCGHCRTAFDALDGLIDVAGAPAAGSTAPPAAPPAADLPAAGAAPAPQDDGLRRAEPAAAYSGEAASRAPAPPDAADAAPQPEPVSQPEPQPHPEPEPKARPEPDAMPLPERAPEPVPETRRLAGAGIDRATSFAEPAAAPPDQSLAPGRVTPLDEMLPAVPTRASRGLRLMWALGGALALIGLAGQALYLFRGEIAHRLPETRAWLDAACREIGCRVPLPGRAELVSVEASELHPDSADKRKLYLAATLKNRAPFDQAYPHLELTLTDTRDQAVVRRVFAPQEYLAEGADASAGFAANADQVVSLALETSANGATGYRVYVFYP